MRRKSLTRAVIGMLVLCGAAGFVLSGCRQEPAGPDTPRSPRDHPVLLSLSGAEGAVDRDLDGVVGDGVLPNHAPDLDDQRHTGFTPGASVPAGRKDADLVSGTLSHVIDFETPSLGGSPRLLIDPYVDGPTGVIFTAAVVNFAVGLVRNSNTSVCVEPPDANQKLGTGVGETSIGFAGIPIRASFPGLLPPPVVVSVDIQMLAGATARLRLFDDQDGVIASVSQAAGPPDGTCGYPGNPRARTTLTVMSYQAVAYAIVDAPSQNVVFVIDDFGFDFGFSLDIKPESCPNTLNPKSRGVLPVAIVGSGAIDVSEIDLASLALEGVPPDRARIDDVAAPFLGAACDCWTSGPDGIEDLTVKFSTEMIAETLGNVAEGDVVPLTLTGTLLDGRPFQITDCVRIVGNIRDEQDFVTR